MIITALERQKRQRRLRVYVDGAFALSLALSLAQEKGLHEGMAMSAADLRSLRREDERHTAYEAALRLLSYRPRSEKEMRFRLGRRGVAPEVVDETVRRLRRAHYLDDGAFAQFWARAAGQRESAQPGPHRAGNSGSRGSTPTRPRRRSTGLDDEEAAYRAAAKRLHCPDRAEPRGLSAPAGRISDAARLQLRRCPAHAGALLERYKRRRLRTVGGGR